MHNGVIARLGLPLHYVPVDLPPGHLRGFFGSSARETSSVGTSRSPTRKKPPLWRTPVRRRWRSAARRTPWWSGKGNSMRRTRMARGSSMPSKRRDGDVDSAASSSSAPAGRPAASPLPSRRAGAREIVLLNRHPRRAERVARLLSARFPAVVFAAGDLRPPTLREEFRGADLIVQCTSLGLRGEWENFPIKDVQKSSRFADIVYRAGGTDLVRRLRARGVKTVGGLPMLAYQAARSFSLWTGRDVPGEAFRKLAVKALKL